MDLNESRLEARLRRLAKTVDYRIEKSRVRNPHFNNQGEYQLIANYYNVVVAGVNYDASLSDIEGFIMSERSRMGLATA